jgi:two-component system cell cycle response regulator DivK
MRNKPLILVVDDESSFLEIMGEKLGVSGFDVVTAKNEAEAISQSEKFMPDLILMDINMPGGSGTDAALAIKQNPKTKGLKIAFLTNAADPWPTISADHKQLSKELGMEDFLEKTDDLDVIVQKTRALLGTK